MTQQALLRRDSFVRGATPVEAPAMTAAFAPGLRRFEIHSRVYAIMLGAIATFFGAYVAAFSGGAGMPILLTICGLSFVAYFGLASLLDGVSGDRLPDQSFATFLRHDIDTASGPMSGRAALWQVVTLPLLMAGFGLFVLGYKLFA